MNKKCEKCGYESKDLKEIEKGKYLCLVCSKFAPSNPTDLQEYLQEKINWQVLETFRKFSKENKNISGMEKKARAGSIVSRAPFGYKLENKELIIDTEKSLIVHEIFTTFLEKNLSLNSLAKKYGFSVNGIKKILRNFTYIGKVKFAGQICQGKHKPIITPELFNKVQNKLESLGIK